MAAKKVKCADLVLSLGGVIEFEGTTGARVDSSGEATLYDVTDDDSLHLTIADVRWTNGERDVRTVERHTSPSRFDRLVHGLRIGVHGATDGDRAALRLDLRQAQMTKPNWAQARKAGRAALNAGAGCDVAKLLTKHGASRIDEREVLIGDKSTHRHTLCVLFPERATLVPPLAYVLTRVAPVRHNFAVPVVVAP